MSIKITEAAARINVGRRMEQLEKEVKETRSGLTECLKRCQQSGEYRELAQRHEKAVRELYTVKVVDRALKAGILSEGGMISLG